MPVTILLITLAAFVFWQIVRGASSGSVSTRSTSANAGSIKPLDGESEAGTFWEVDEPFPVQAELLLHYMDVEGRKSERVVSVKQFGAGVQGNLLIGHCHLRDERRTFRVDRVHQCVDVETGEIVPDIHAFLRARYELSPEAVANKLLVAEYDALRILLFVGKADGQLRAAERTIIRATCKALAKDSQLQDGMIDRIFADLEVPTMQAFKLAVNRCVTRPVEQRQALLRAAIDMIATQKSVHPTEQEALDYLRKRLTPVT